MIRDEWIWWRLAMWACLFAGMLCAACAVYAAAPSPPVKLPCDSFRIYRAGAEALVVCPNWSPGRVADLTVRNACQGKPVRGVVKKYDAVKQEWQLKFYC